jgi:hypothetical protein
MLYVDGQSKVNIVDHDQVNIDLTLIVNAHGTPPERFSPEDALARPSVAPGSSFPASNNPGTASKIISAEQLKPLIELGFKIKELADQACVSITFFSTSTC